MAKTQVRRRSVGSSPVHFYHTYHFRADEQDPVIDRMRTIMDDEGEGDGKKGFAKIHEACGLSTSTLGNWFTSCKTRRPQYASIAAFVRSFGYDVAFIKVGNKANGKPWGASPPKIITQFRTAR